MNTGTGISCAVVFLISAAILIPALHAQDVEYARRNTFTVLTQYSPDSGHILAGYAQDRKLFALGVEYERKIYSDRRLALTWMMQARPFIREDDLALTGYRLASGETIAVPPERVATPGEADLPGAVPLFDHVSTYVGGVNPLGMKLNIGVRHRWQPVATGMFGFIIGSRDVPVDHSSAFNFVAEFGGGVEYFPSQAHSLRFEYRLHHYSNAQLGTRNPGVDSGIFQFSYSFGK